MGLAMLIAQGMIPAVAKDVHAAIGVSATVRAVARLEQQSAPAQVNLTAADVARGYVDVSQPTALVIRSNSATGYALELMTVTPMLSSMVVYGLDSDLALGADGGTVVQRWRNPGVVNLRLKFRFSLAPGLRPGSYPWPLRLAVRPLEAI